MGYKILGKGGREMIIVSQDKEEIVNFDKVESIWIDADMLAEKVGLQ